MTPVACYTEGMNDIDDIDDIDAADAADASPQQARHHVVQLLGPSAGGIRAHVAELARRLEQRGYEVTVLGPAHVMDGVGEQAGVVDVPSTWNPLGVMRARRQLMRRCGGATVLHAHGLKAGLVALTIRRRPPMVLTIHNLVIGTHHGVASGVLQRLESFIIGRADHVIVISDEIRQRLRGIVSDDQQTFVLPVSPTRSVGMTRHEVRMLHGIADDAPLVVIVARQHVQKDLPMFLRAMALVHAAMPTARAVMVGDGPERRSVETERERLGLDKVVVVAGHRPNPVDEMNAADVVAVSSSWEGSPLVVAECLALGRPLVTTAVGTVTRHLTDGIDAAIVPVGDHVALARNIEELLTDQTLAATIGAAGRLTAAVAFDAEHLIDGVEQVYLRVIG
jgi:glycosyltransferase involved in cell wall biosynthesis